MAGMEKTKLREPGLMERFHITRSDGGYDTCVVLSAKYTTPTGSVLDRTTVLRALKRVLLTRPALCVQVAGEHPDPKDPYFYALPKVNLNDVLKYHEYVGKSVQEVLNSELHIPFARDVENPLWRVVVHDDNTVAFAYHHAIGDGRSGLGFHHAFLSALNLIHSDGSDDRDESFVVDVPSGLTLPPAIESCTDVTLSWKNFLKMFYDAFAPASWQTGYRAWTGNPVISTNDTTVEVRLQKIAAADAKALLTLCRQNKCTLTSFLHTLAVCALSHILKTREDAHQYTLLSTSTPVSLRPLTGVSLLEMCDHVSHYPEFPQIMRDVQHPFTKSTFPWETASKYSTALQGCIKDSRQNIGTIKYLYSLGLSGGFFSGQAGKKRGQTLELSNVGAMSKDTAAVSGPWEVDDVSFLQSNAVCGAAIKMNVAGSPSGTVNIAYTWGVGAVEKEVVETFVKEVHDGIASILEPTA